MSLVEARNVQVQDYDGVVLAGFWQYGTVSWTTFFTWLHTLILTNERWTIFEFDDDSPDRHGAEHSASDMIVPAGVYILLQQGKHASPPIAALVEILLPDGSPVHARLTESFARRRQPTHSNTPAREDHYRIRTRERDGKCLVSGRVSATWSRLKAAHIFPRVHDIEWSSKGYPSLITDVASIQALGGPTKIDSIQNTILMKSDLHDMWDNYEFGVNPDDNYRITAFINGLDDVHGLTLQLDHIVDPTIRPLDELFRDHFLQGVLKHIKGGGEPTWDYENHLGGGAVDLSSDKVWGNEEGKERLELELADRLFEHRVTQEV